MMKVKFLSKSEIEWNAEELLADFGARFGRVDAPPVPVEEILENHLKLSLEFDDLAARFRVPDALGALWVEERLVVIDSALDPEEHPELEGRYRWTIGHETGHWNQHRHYFLADPNQLQMFPELRREPSILCRSSQVKEPIEWQADYYSGCLLVPRRLVTPAWAALKADAGKEIVADSPIVDGMIRELARIFQVSRQAMRIRLEDLNLLPQPMPLFEQQARG